MDLRVIKSQVGYLGTEHFVVDINGPTVIDFVQQVDDVMIVSPEGDILISWDNEKFSEDNCILISPKDNLKEIGVARCTKFYMMPKEKEKTIKVYITGQRN